MANGCSKKRGKDDAMGRVTFLVPKKALRGLLQLVFCKTTAPVTHLPTSLCVPYERMYRATGQDVAQEMEGK